MTSTLLRLGVSKSAGASPSDAVVAELEMELALLREENARLKVERHRSPNAGQIIERMRELRLQRGAESHGSAAAQAQTTAPLQPETATPTAAALAPAGIEQAIVECLGIRDSLIEACQEVEQAMQGIHNRLGTLSIDLQKRAGEGAVSNRVAVVATEAIDMELAVGAPASSGHAQNTATA